MGTIKVNQNVAGPFKSIDLGATVFRACRACGEANPSFVECPQCGLVNRANEACRGCRYASPLEGKPWTTCPSCGTSGIREALGTIAYWHRNPIMRWGYVIGQAWRSLHREFTTAYKTESERLGK